MTDSQKVALVTGASSGIGCAIAQRLGRDGFHVLVHYNSNEEGAKKTVNSILEKDGRAESITFDIKNSSNVTETLDAYFKKHSTYELSALVNNAGIHNDTLLGFMTDDVFEDVVQTNLFGTFYVLRWGAKKMLRQRSGAIVNISSLAGQTGNAGQINYAASKAGIIAMTKSLAVEVGSRGIRVNAVAPGFIETDMIEEIPNLEEFKKRIPFKRFGTSDEVAGAVSFLLSNDSTYITGHTISVNGGLYPS